MKLYEVNQAIADIFDQMVDPETGEIITESDALMAQLETLQMERSSILSYLAKLVLNNRAEQASLKEEERRLKERRTRLEKKENRLMQVLDRECAGQTTDCGVATFRYRKTSRVDIADAAKVIHWLKRNKHHDCYRIPEPEVSKTEVRKLLVSGENIPGVTIFELTKDICFADLSGITALNGNVVVLHFRDGTERRCTWKDRSRSESWNADMKEAARQRAFEQHRRNRNA